jgi:chromosome segregation protein
MSHVKKLVLHGFKSFANKTELPFDKTINVIIGPNGSGKSNISDALCFVLGRLSSKSMRAAKASNLIFQGSKTKKPSQEASVELVLDNSEKAFNINTPEVSVKRTVKRTGQSTYRINEEVKTRQEVLELLSQAGIDPNGFNLVLQGQIARLVKMSPDERREIVEEIAGISIYEVRKQKSMKEIDKTEQKLKEVSAVLRERTSYLKNLEQERKQALKFKELESTVKRCKLTILSKRIEEKSASLGNVNKEVEKNNNFKNKIKSEIETINTEIIDLEAKANEISKYIQKTTGLERETLSEEVTNLNARIAADSARKENFEKKLSDNDTRKDELEANIIDFENELESLKKESPKVSKKQEEIKLKKQELEQVGNEKDKLSSVQSEINNTKDRIRDKENLLLRNKTDAKALYAHIESLSHELSSQTLEECNEEITSINKQIKESEINLNELTNKKLQLEKKLSVHEAEITRNESLKQNLPDSETCPLCQIKLTKDHRTHVTSEADSTITENKSGMEELEEQLIQLNKENKETIANKLSLNEELTKRQTELTILNAIEEKKESITRLVNHEKEIQQEIETLQSKSDNAEKKLSDRNTTEERYNKLFFELQELSSITDENLDTTILYKEREIESISQIIRGITKDRSQLEHEINRLTTDLTENQTTLTKKQTDLETLNRKFKEKFEERTQVQELIKKKNIQLVEKQNIVSRFNDAINNHKVNIAKISAEKESLEYEIKEFPDTELLQGSIQVLEDKLRKSEAVLMTLGNINMRALETYDEIKEEYDKISDRVTGLETERDEILKIIDEIDRKKKRTFMKTFNEINDLFTRNFTQLSVKGKAFLEIENKDNIFEGGVTITIRVAKGKYFDVTSLSGGEQTLIALSLIFAIQEFKPYAFYILDEIDAALDKRNSELLANLLKKYIQSGQYIAISHNDSIITGANTLYGVSMNSGISKVLSLDVKENAPEEIKPEIPKV